MSENKQTTMEKQMIDLSYKKYTNKDYAVDEVHSILKTEKKELRKLKTSTLLQILSKLS